MQRKNLALLQIARLGSITANKQINAISGEDRADRGNPWCLLRPQCRQDGHFTLIRVIKQGFSDGGDIRC
jgi:hypothetical protein